MPLPDWVFNCPYAQHVASNVYSCEQWREYKRDDKNITMVGPFCDVHICTEQPKIINGNWKFESKQIFLSRFCAGK